MMNTEYHRRHALMNRTSSGGYLRTAITGSRESVDADDLYDGNSDAGSVRSTASVTSYKTLQRARRRQRNRRAYPMLERAQSLFGDSTTEPLNFTVTRENIDPFSFGPRRPPIAPRPPIPHNINNSRQDFLESSAEVGRDTDHLDYGAAEEDSLGVLSPIQQSPLEPYYSSSSLDTSSEEESEDVSLSLPPSSEEHRNTSAWILTGSYGSTKEPEVLARPPLGVAVARKKIVTKKMNGTAKRSSQSKPSPVKPVTGGLNELGDIMDDAGGLQRPSTPPIGQDESSSEPVTNGFGEDVEGQSMDSRNVYGVEHDDVFHSNLSNNRNLVASSTPADTIPPSFDESEIPASPLLMRLRTPESESIQGSSSSQGGRLYSVEDVETSSDPGFSSEQRPLRQEEITDASSLPGSGGGGGGGGGDAPNHPEKLIPGKRKLSPSLLRNGHILEKKPPAKSPDPSSRSVDPHHLLRATSKQNPPPAPSSPRELRSSRSSDDYFRHSTLEAVAEEEDSQSDAEPMVAKKAQDAFNEKMEEIKRDVSESDFFTDKGAALSNGHVRHSGQVDSECGDDACDLLLTEDEGVRAKKTDANNSSQFTDSTARLDSTDRAGLNNSEQIVKRAPPSNGASKREKKRLPMTTSDKSALCGCCEIM